MTENTGGTEIDVDDYADDLEDELTENRIINRAAEDLPQEEPSEPDRGDAGEANVEPSEIDADQMDRRAVEDDNPKDGGPDAGRGGGI